MLAEFLSRGFAVIITGVRELQLTVAVGVVFLLHVLCVDWQRRANIVALQVRYKSIIIMCLPQLCKCLNLL